MRKLIKPILLFLLLLCSCTSTAPADTSTNEPSSEDQSNQELSDSEFPAGQSWDETVASARGQTVNFYMWGGNDLTNTWVSGYAADQLKAQFDITLNMMPVTEIQDVVSKVLGEKQAGKENDGSVDLMWINGENFRSMHEAGLLYGPWSEIIPNSQYVNWNDPSVANDFGYPVQGFESPYGKAQFVMIYDSAKIPQPPASMGELVTWIQENPGKFTYAAPPDFTGSVFVREVCYHVTGGYEQFMGEFDEDLFDEKFSVCWQALNDLEPYLWRDGETYPEDRTHMKDLFANGEVYFDMTYSPNETSSLTENGQYPESARTFVFEEGTIANTHYLAIPFNASQKAASMVVANFMLSPEAQYSKADPTGWGDLTALDPALLPQEWAQKFSELPRGAATLSDAELAAHRQPELQATWLTAIEETWESTVLYGD